jgi:hypothetical protein
VRRVFLASPWLPAEWIAAHGMQPYGIWFLPEFGTVAPPCGAGLCGFAHSMQQLAGNDRDSLFVFPSHCDQLRRAYDAAAAMIGSQIFLFNLPSASDSPVAQKIYRAEMERLGRFLIRAGGRTPDPEGLSVLMTHYAHVRGSLSERAERPGREFLECLTGLHTGRPVPYKPEIRTTQSSTCGVQLAMVGGPFPGSQWTLLNLVEDLGGSIALYAAEPGERNVWQDKETIRDSSENDPSALNLELRLANNYLRHMTDVYQRPNTKLYKWLGERLRSRNVRGILLWHYAWCDLWRAEAQSLREAFGLPVLPLEADAAQGGMLRTTGRIEAFIESLQ